MKVMGHIPTGWFPSKIAVSGDGKKMYVANAKGFGSGPNGGKDFVPGPEGSNIGRLMKGTISIVDIPNDAELNKQTQQVVDNNFRFERVNHKKLQSRQKNPIPILPKRGLSPIKYWVFIPKENRTYDEILGQLPHANGDSTIARFGRNVTIANSGKTNAVQNVTVAPNHLSLAEKFAISDNFYVDADHSADGHRWLTGTYPNEWVETSTAASYGGNRSMRANSKAPGNLSMLGASSAIYPEDYNEAGSIWII
jgi:phospholipase C